MLVQSVQDIGLSVLYSGKMLIFVGLDKFAWLVKDHLPGFKTSWHYTRA